MIVEHAGKRPRVHERAWVAPNAVVSGDVSVGEGARILFGAVVIRGRAGRPARIGAHAHDRVIEP